MTETRRLSERQRRVLQVLAEIDHPDGRREDDVWRAGRDSAWWPEDAKLHGQLRALAERGLVERLGRVSSTDPFRWRITDEGRRVLDEEVAA